MSFRRLVSLGILGAVGIALWFAIPVIRRELAESGLQHYRSELASTPGVFRSTSGRLRGFPYQPDAPADSAVRGVDRTLSQISLDIERELTVAPSPRAQAEMALVQLAARKPDEAVKLLEDAVSANSEERPQFLNDLAVAYLYRGEAPDHPHDIARALDAADLALEAAPTLSEACFNRALALERLQLVKQAERAWKNCAVREQDPDWRREIERHLASLGQSSKPLDIEAALQSHDQAALDSAVATDPQSARKLALEKLLPEWVEARQTGDLSKAREMIAAGLALGRALDGRDAMVVEVFKDLELATEQTASSARLATLTEGIQSYLKAQDEYSSNNFKGSYPLFERAHDLLTGVRSPLAAWAELGEIRCEFYWDHFDAVLARLDALQQEIDDSRFPLLAMYCHWIRAMTYSRQGDLNASLGDFREMAGYSERVGESEYQGVGHQMVGEMYRILGNEEDAWRYRLQGLKFLRGTPASKWRLLLLRDACESLLAEKLNHAALEMQDEAVLSAPPSLNVRDRADILLWRARALTQLGRLKEAWEELGKARNYAVQVQDAALQKRSVADIGFAKAVLVSRTDPDGALADLDKIADTYRAKGHMLPLAALWLNSARLARDLNRPADESRYLDEGIRLFEQEWQSLGTDKERVSFLDTSQEAFDARIRLAVENADAITALEFSERARAFWTDSPGTDGSSWVVSLKTRGEEPCSAASQDILPPQIVVLEYALVDDRLLLWQLRCGSLRFFSLDVTPKRVAELAQQFRSFARGDSPQSFNEVAATAYDLFLGKAADGIPAGTTLVIVPDKALYGIPFAALRNRSSGRFLVENHEIIYAPSATFLKAELSRPAADLGSGDVLLVSPLNPELTESKNEIDDLHRLYPKAELLTGARARKELILQDLDRHRILHYAGHAEVHSYDPFMARLPLGLKGDPEALSVQELEGSSFQRLDLVVLSACGSVAAAPTRSGGFLGLARPFLSGGVRSVVGTLWDVDDKVSRAALVDFHRELQEGLSPAAALRAVQCRDIRTGSFPSAWVPFAIVGEGRGVHSD